MSSRFVPAGANPDQEPAASKPNDDWERAKKLVEAQKAQKIESGKQEGGKSLYEVLQQNKAAKQDAFEESIRLKNQFRTLDDDEVEFLGGMQAEERAKENAVKRETAEQLEMFRKQRQAAEQNTIRDDQKSETMNELSVPESWTLKKKRKRDRDSKLVLKSKIRKDSTSEDTANTTTRSDSITKAQETPKTLEADTTRNPSVSEDHVERSKTGEKLSASGLGLGAYSSDDDD